MDAESDQFVGVGDGEPRFAHLLDELAIYIEDAECDELVGIETFDVSGLDFFCEGDGDVEDGHGKLFVVIDTSEAQRGHLLNVLWFRSEMENAGAFAVIEVAFAFEAASVASDREFDVLPAGF